MADMGDESIMNTASDPLLEKYGDDAPITMAEDTASVASDISFSGIFIRLAQNGRLPEVISLCSKYTSAQESLSMIEVHFKGFS